MAQKAQGWKLCCVCGCWSLTLVFAILHVIFFLCFPVILFFFLHSAKINKLLKLTTWQWRDTTLSSEVTINCRVAFSCAKKLVLCKSNTAKYFETVIKYRVVQWYVVKLSASQYYTSFLLYIASFYRWVFMSISYISEWQSMVGQLWMRCLLSSASNSLLYHCVFLDFYC